MNKAFTGKLGETETAREYRKRGYSIVSANFHSRYGEIDVIAENGDSICFVEVKTRAPGQIFRPADAVTSAKRKKIISTAEIFLSQYPTKKNPRFDISEVIAENGRIININIIENAF